MRLAYEEMVQAEADRLALYYGPQVIEDIVHFLHTTLGPF